MYVECGLSKIVELEWSGKGNVGIVLPEVDWVEHTRRQTAVNVLKAILRVRDLSDFEWTRETYEAV